MATEVDPSVLVPEPIAGRAVPMPTADTPSGEKVRITGRLRKLTIFNLFANVGIFALWGAIPAILLPLQVQGIDPANKVANLAIILTISSFGAMLAQPIAGMLSDRTRSRFGRRTPWMLGGVLIGGLAIIGIASANTIVEVAIAWFIVQVAYNFTQGPLSAVLPDRVPSAARGRFSSITGLGTMIGAIGGQIGASQFTKNIPAGYLFFAGIALIAIVLFVIFNPDASNKGEPRNKFSLITFLKTFWVNPRKHPDFAWGFTGRILLFAGYYLVSGYQLYILSDYIGLGSHAAGAVALLGGASLVGIVITMSIAGPISDKLGRRRIVAVIAGVILAASLIIPLVSPTLPGMIAYSFVGGLGFGAYMSVDGALMSEVLPSKVDFGKDLGVLNIAATLPQTLGPAIAGAIVLIFHGYAALFPIGAVIALLGAVAVIPIKSVR